jgi:hypothetical protein
MCCNSSRNRGSQARSGRAQPSWSGSLDTRRWDHCGRADRGVSGRLAAVPRPGTPAVVGGRGAEHRCCRTCGHSDLRRPRGATRNPIKRPGAVAHARPNSRAGAAGRRGLLVLWRATSRRCQRRIVAGMHACSAVARRSTHDGDDQCAVCPRQSRPGVVAAQNGELVAQHEDLDVLVCLGAGEQRYPAQQPGHGSGTSDGAPPGDQAEPWSVSNPQVTAVGRVLGTHTLELVAVPLDGLRDHRVVDDRGHLGQ